MHVYFPFSAVLPFLSGNSAETSGHEYIFPRYNIFGFGHLPEILPLMEFPRHVPVLINCIHLARRQNTKMYYVCWSDYCQEWCGT